MGNYSETFKSKMNWANALERTDPFPLDRTSMWGSYSDALKYAKANPSDPDERGLYGLSYIGQVITVYEDGKISVYKISESRNLEELGSDAAINAVKTEVLNKFNDYASSGDTATAIGEVKTEVLNKFNDYATSGDTATAINDIKNDVINRLNDYATSGDTTTAIGDVKTEVLNKFNDYPTKNDTVSNIEGDENIHVVAADRKVSLSLDGFNGGEFIYDANISDFTKKNEV